MSAIVSCKDHDHSRRSIYDMCDTNEGGEVSNYNSITHIMQKTSADFIHLLSYLYPVPMLFFSRLPSRFTSRPTSQFKPGKFMDCFERPVDLIVSSIAGLIQVHIQPPLLHLKHLLIPNVIYVRLISHLHSTMKRMTLQFLELNVVCATNAIGRWKQNVTRWQKTAKIVQVLWVWLCREHWQIKTIKLHSPLGPRLSVGGRGEVNEGRRVWENHEYRTVRIYKFYNYL